MKWQKTIQHFLTKSNKKQFAYQHQNRYTGCINSQKLFEHEMDCWEKNLPTPALPFKTITKQARDLGLKCKGARNDFVGYMQMREYY